MITTNTRQGMTIVDYSPGMTVPPIPINFYSALTSSPYFCAINFLSGVLTRIPRVVTKDGVPLKVPHPVQKLLERRPNRYQNAAKFWRALIFNAAHYNNGYARIERNVRTLQPVALHNLLAENITPFRFKIEDSDELVQYYADLKARKYYVGDDIIHLAGSSYDGMKGIDTIALHSGTLQMASTQDRFALKYLQNGTNVRAVIEFDGDLPPEKRQQVQELLREQYTGLDSTDDTLLLGNGAKYRNLTSSLNDGQFTQQQTATTKKIAQITGVDPFFMFDKSESKYTGAAEAGENLVRFTLASWIDQIENELSVKLLSDAEMDAGLWIECDTKALVQGDIKAVTDLAIAKKNAGLTTPNQALAEIGMPQNEDPEANKLKTLGDTAPPKPTDGSDTK